MSSKLKPVDLTGATVGTTGTINFNQFIKFAPNDMRKKASVRILNESGCGLDTTFQASGNYHFLPAGAWGTFDVEPNDASISITVTYVLPNPPVSMVQAIYYLPGESVPQSFTLGNSPIGIGGTITTSSVQTLSNETNAVKTLVIDVGLSTATLLYELFSDGSATWSVISGGAAHTVIQINGTGNPLLLGEAGDIAEMLGALLVDQTATITGQLIVNRSGVAVNIANGSLTVAAGITNNGNLAMGANTISGTGAVNMATGTFTGLLQAGGGFTLNGGDVTMNGHNLLSCATGTFTTNINLPTIGTLKALTSASGTGNGTSNTLVTNPTAIVCDCCTLSGSTQTMGATKTTTTTITTNSALGWSYIAYLQ